jgi:hypothetical protein
MKPDIDHDCADGPGTAIAIAFARSPLILAHVAWDLRKASGEGFVLGRSTA